MTEGLLDRAGWMSRVRDLTPRKRVAFAASCAQRVLPVVGISGDSSVLPFRAAIDAAWLYAAGMPSNPTGANRIFREAVVVLPEPEHVSPSSEAYFHAAVSACSSVEALFRDSVRAALDAAERAQRAVESLDGEAGAQEEREWQDKVLVELSGIVSESVNPDVIRRVQPGVPEWYARHVPAGPLMRYGSMEES